MKILVIGSGAREHSITAAFSQSKGGHRLYTAPGNAGTYDIGTNLPDLDPAKGDDVVKICREKHVDLVFIGPEEPLANGLADQLLAEHIAVLGPDRKAARLESSKIFAKEFMESYRIPTPRSAVHANSTSMEKTIRGRQGPLVIKKDGLAAGKGVLVSDDETELLAFGSPLINDGPILIEECLEGYEISVFLLMDGKNTLTFPSCSDYKRAWDGDKGPNTGGMGAICPVPWVDAILENTIQTEILQPTVRGLRDSGLFYRGVLYFGLMITGDGPKVLEFNVRLGDPECQVLLPLIGTDFAELATAAWEGHLDSCTVSVHPLYAVGVVVASEGYPSDYAKGIPVQPIVPGEGCLIYHASTSRSAEGTILTGGGRCFTCVGTASDLRSAARLAREGTSAIQFSGAWHRNDIGVKYFDGENK